MLCILRIYYGKMLISNILYVPKQVSLIANYVSSAKLCVIEKNESCLRSINKPSICKKIKIHFRHNRLYPSAAYEYFENQTFQVCKIITRIISYFNVLKFNKDIMNSLGVTIVESCSKFQKSDFYQNVYLFIVVVVYIPRHVTFYPQVLARVCLILPLRR